MKKKTYHVKHILVTHEYEAQDVLRLLKQGQEFEALAKKFSKCSSNAQGGDLGPIPYGAADENFEESALILKAGETTAKPVRSRFGYHIIRRLS